MDPINLHLIFQSLPQDNRTEVKKENIFVHLKKKHTLSLSDSLGLFKGF